MGKDIRGDMRAASGHIGHGRKVGRASVGLKTTSEGCQFEITERFLAW